MRKYYFLVLIFLFASTSVKSQCPVANYNIPDTVCAGESFQVQNATTGGTSYYWDLCPGDMSVAPVSSTLSSDPVLNFPQQLRAVTDNGNHYIFIANLLGNNLIRYDFGNDIDNIPTVFDYGNVGGLFNLPAGLDVVNDNGIWYALVSNANANNIIRIVLGPVISANTATPDDIGSFNLNTPRGVKIVKDAGDYFAFISTVGGSLTKINFGNSLANTPITFFGLTDPSFDVPWGFDIAYDCSINSWVGFYASNNLNKINVIDFGASLTNTGIVVSSFPCLTSPSGIALTREGSRWYILLNSFSTTEYQKIEITGNLLNAPASTQTQFLPQTVSPRNLTVFRDSSEYKIIIANNNPSTLVKLVYSKPCFSLPAISNDPVSVSPLISLLNAYQEIVLEAYGPNGETSVYNDSIYIAEAPAAAFTGIDACEGDSNFFTNTSILNPNLVTTWQWDFGDSSPVDTNQNPVHLYSGQGAFNVTLTASYTGGCSNSFSDSVYVYPLPVADFSFLNNQCSAVPVLFNDISQTFGGAIVTSWQWDFGDATPVDNLQNPSHPFTLPGTYTVTLTVETNTGCIDSVTQVITIIPAPVAEFTVSSTCVGETVNFLNTTTIQGGGSITYNWDFGDTFTSTSISPAHQYSPSPGNYNVTLIATASNLCKDTIIQDIRISNQPVPQFTWSPLVICKFNQVSFTSTSFGVGGDTIAAYQWDFGDSGTSTDQNPFHAYSDTGFYNVTLTVVSPTACDSSITQQLYVIPSPTASFTANDVCLGLQTIFNPLTTTPTNTQIDSIVWDFGDSVTFTGLISPTHTYLLPGTYVVTMTVYNNLLCTGSYLDSVIVYPVPLASFTASLACSGSEINFDGTVSQVINDTISSWLWDFNGSGTATDSISQFTFSNPGTYNITLIVSTIHGCQDTVQSTVTVIQSPQFDFVFNEPCFGLPSSFTYQPLIPIPNALLSWDFGDGTISSQLSPIHAYSTIDTFNVTLTVLDNSTGCSTTMEHPLVIKPYPSAGFSFNNNCENLPVQFTDTSSIMSGSIISWNWNFGNLGTSPDINPVIIPVDPGSYPVNLTVTSDEGCATTVSDTLTVYGNPVAAFTPDPLFGSPPLNVNFINTSIGGVSFDWTFGDGTTGSGLNVSHSYLDTGLYNISLIVTSAEGCIDSTGSLISVLIPFLDIAVNRIFITEESNLLTVMAELLNMGNVPVSTFEISANIQNGSVINEEWSGDFQPGDAMMYTFSARFDINSKVLPGFYCVEAINPNDDVDQNLANNKLCAVISNVFEVFTAFPNPFINELSLSMNLPLQGNYDVEIFDMAGKIVYRSQDIKGNKGYNKITIPTLTFRKGIYAVLVRYRDEVKTINVMNY